MEQQKQPQNEENKIIIQDYFAGETPTPTNTPTSTPTPNCFSITNQLLCPC